MVIVSFVPTLIMRYGILENYEQRAVSLRTMELQDQITVIANHLGNNHYLQDAGQQTINAELLQLSSLYDGRVLIVDDNFRVIKDTYGIGEGKTAISESVLRSSLGESISNYDSENQFIEITVPITEMPEATEEEGESEPKEAEPVIVGVMLTSVSTANIAANIEVMNTNAGVLQILMLLFVIALGALLSKLMVRPLDRVTTAIHDVKNGFETSA
ncbi:MAG: two-component sensor histidine kinase, partial [Lachnospiraceae bacterium]|nr:two-component sensor histidine kinase [Lachnospiraceae bacterium]